jgi:hypothetical protein
MPQTYSPNQQNPPGRPTASEIFQELGQELKTIPGDVARGIGQNAKESLTTLASLPLVVVALPGMVLYQFTVNVLAWAPILAAPVVLPLMLVKPRLADKIIEKMAAGAERLTKPYERPNASWRDYTR